MFAAGQLPRGETPPLLRPIVVRRGQHMLSSMYYYYYYWCTTAGVPGSTGSLVAVSNAVCEVGAFFLGGAPPPVHRRRCCACLPPRLGRGMLVLACTLSFRGLGLYLVFSWWLDTLVLLSGWVMVVPWCGG